MKHRAHWPLILLFITCTIFAIRLSWVVMNTTIGWPPLWEQWSDVAADLVGTEMETLNEKDPKAQAEFWLQQVSQVEQANTDAKVALGAAWILDSPQNGFFQRYIKTNEMLDSSVFSLRMRMELDYEAIELLTDEFESLCRDECLEKVETAIRLESDNVEMWRAYALLLFKQQGHGIDLSPRRDDWQAILDECTKHDPENALYDYLAALYLWSSSAEYDWHEGETIRTMNDRTMFDLGTKRYHAGLTKPILNFGTIGHIATLNFLNETSVPFPDQLTAAESRQIGGRIVALLYRILRLQSRQAELDTKAEKYPEVISSARNVIRVSEQVLKGDGYFYYSPVAQQLRLCSLFILKDLNESHPGVMEAAEARKISEEYYQLQLEVEVLQEVQKRYKSRPKGDDPDIPIWAILIMPTTQSLFMISFCLGLFSSFVALLAGNQNQHGSPQAKWYMHLTAWVAGIGLSFTLFGLIPAKIIPPTIQTGFIYGLIWFIFIAFLFGFFCLLRKWLRLSWRDAFALWTAGCLLFVIGFHFPAWIQFIIRVVATLHPLILILVFFALAFFCWMLLRTLLNFTISKPFSRRRIIKTCLIFLFFGFCTDQGITAVTTGLSDHLNKQSWITPAVWHKAKAVNISSRDLENEMKSQGANWTWALIQWHTFLGPLTAPFVVMGILLLWHTIKRTRSMPGGLREMLRPWKHIRQDSSLVAKSCLVSSLIFLLFYLWVYPTIAIAMDAKYHDEHETLVNPMKIQNEYAKLTAQVKSDRTLMDQITVDVEETNRITAEQKQMRE